jgi:hypothetical protein
MIVYILTSILAYFYMLCFICFLLIMVFDPPTEKDQYTLGNIIAFVALFTSCVLFLNL